MSFFKSLVKVVVGAAAIAAAVYTGGASLGLTSAAFSMAGLAAAAGTAALYSAIAFGASALLSESATGTDVNFGNEIRGQLVTQRSASASARVVYGKTRLATNIVFAETTGSTNQTLFQVGTLAGHQITAVDQLYINDDLFSGTYKGSSSAFAYDVLYGSATQSPSSLLSGTTASAYQYKGIAALVMKFVYNQDVYTQGIPNVTAVVRGKAVFDPRSQSTGYSNNAALCIRDYLIDTTYGFGAQESEIDDASFIAAANICDEQIRVGTNSPAVYESRYTINGAFSSEQQPKVVLKKMLTACGGALNYTGGKWTLKVAAWRTPTMTITEDEIIGEINMQASQSKRDIFNSIKGIYSSPLDLYQPVSFPPVTNSTYISEDGETIWKDVEYAFTTSYATCQRLAKIELEKARQQIIVNLSVNLKGFALQPADNVYITFDRYGWSNKVFEVLNWEFSSREMNGIPTPMVNLTLKETAQSVYDWNGGEETTVDPSPNTNLPDAFVVNAPSNLQATVQAIVLQDGSTQNAIVLTWDAPVSSFVSQYEVQYIRGSSSFDWGLITEASSTTVNYGSITAAATLTNDWGLIVDPVPSQETNYNSVFTTVTNYTIVPVVEGIEYSIRVRAYNITGVRSAWTSLTETPVGDTTPPALPDNIVVLSGYKQLTLSWNNPPEADFDFVEVFSNTVNNQLTANRVGLIRASIFVHSGLGINQTRYYWLRSVDKSGNRSNFTTMISGTTSFIDSDQFSQEVMNLFSEAGAYGIEPVTTLPPVGDFNGQIKYETSTNKLWRWQTDNSPYSWTDDIFSITAGSVDLASFASGLEPISIVSSLPSTTGYAGAKVVFLTTDYKLYRLDTSSSPASWTSEIPAVDISGTLSADNFASTLRPVEVVGTLPSTGNFVGRMAYLTTDNKLYRFTASGWIATIASTDITGTLVNAQIQDLSAAKITGTLTNSQIADLAAAKITGQITGTQITDGAISTPKLSAGSVTTDRLAASAVTADKIDTNAVTADKINANAVTTAKIAAAAVTADTIAANAITTSKIAAEAVTANQIASNTITTDKIVANAITSDLLATNSVIAGKIQAGAITADKVAVNAISATNIQSDAIQTDKIVAGAVTTAKIATQAITADKIAANSITTGMIQAGAITASQIATAAISADKIQTGAIIADKIAASAIQTDKIAANAITGGLLATAGVITNTAQINDGLITNAKIVNGAITTAKIGDAQITTAKIGDAQITSAKFSNTIQSDNYVLNTSGWKIQRSGDAEFNGVVLSRQLQVDTGTYFAGSFGDDGYNGNMHEVATFFIETNTAASAWTGTNVTYIALVGRTPGSPQSVVNAYNDIIASQPQNIRWGWEAHVVPLTRWSGNQRLWIKVILNTSYVVSLTNFTLTWRLYRVT